MPFDENFIGEVCHWAAILLSTLKNKQAAKLCLRKFLGLLNIMYRAGGTCCDNRPATQAFTLIYS
jgi:hypothetical protein